MGDLSARHTGQCASGRGLLRPSWTIPTAASSSGASTATSEPRDPEPHEVTGPTAFEKALTCPFAFVTVTSENTYCPTSEAWSV